MCNGTIQRISSKIHVVKDLFYFSYKRLHVDEAFVPDHKIISIIRKLGVKKKLDLVQSWFACKNDHDALISMCVPVCLCVFWEPCAPYLSDLTWVQHVSRETELPDTSHPRVTVEGGNPPTMETFHLSPV